MSADLLLITGASAGIGLATAVRFARDGWEVLNLSRTEVPVQRLEAQIVDRIHSVRIDLSRTDEWGVEELAPFLTEAIQGKARIAMVHNAAFALPDTVSTPNISRLRELLEISVIAPSWLNQLVLPHMQRGSSIIYVGSTLSHRGVTGCFSYVTAKHAVLGMMRATARDLFGRGIHTVGVCPGPTETQMLRGLYADKCEEMFNEKMSEGRLALPDEIAAVIRFAAETPQINGTVIDAAFGEHL